MASTPVKEFSDGPPFRTIFCNQSQIRHRIVIETQRNSIWVVMNSRLGCNGIASLSRRNCDLHFDRDQPKI
ncbi:hypothetical protein TIFTF001_001665 [Ficus carica]|uniref:Uncharacterized protein n=1 Tax=Ficus carica TaxID=3494 RepID=A0AA87Z110_FICCA|nr:hypothetical protein TIFTF001_001665 [Ficus carica]